MRRWRRGDARSMEAWRARVMTKAAIDRREGTGTVLVLSREPTRAEAEELRWEHGRRVTLQWSAREPGAERELLAWRRMEVTQVREGPWGRRRRVLVEAQSEASPP